MSDNPYRSSRLDFKKASQKEMRAVKLFRLLVGFFLLYTIAGHSAFYVRLFTISQKGESDNLSYYFFYILIFGIIAGVGILMIFLTYFYTFRRDQFRRAFIFVGIVLTVSGGLIYYSYEVLESSWISLIKSAFF